MSAQQTLEQAKVLKEDNDAQNEYIVLINKRVRALKKKLQNIGYIETRLANKEEINADQKGVLASKDSTVKALTEIEAIRNQFLQYFASQEKEKKQPAPEPAPVQAPAPKIPPGEETRGILRLLHIARLFDLNIPGGAEVRGLFFAEQARNGRSVVKGDQDIDALFPLCSIIFNSPPVHHDNAVAVALKFLNESEEEFLNKVTFKHLKTVYNEIIASRVFLGIPEQPQAPAEPAKQEPAPTETKPQEEVKPSEVAAPAPEQQAQSQESKPEEQDDGEEGGETGEEQTGQQQFQEGRPQRDGKPFRGRGRGGRGGRGRTGSFRGDKGERGDRQDRGERQDRPERQERGDRGDRGDRSDRGDRGERRGRGGRGGYENRENRGSFSSDRKPRPQQGQSPSQTRP